MSMLLAFVLAGQAPSRILPQVDRRALEIQARAESRQQPSRNVQVRPQQNFTASTRPTATFRPASASNNLDLSAITTICRAAGNQADPANFLATLSRAYSMSPAQSGSLRSSCAAYLAGRADARSVEYVPAH